jgi:CheY-like chemotaxis protein
MGSNQPLILLVDDDADFLDIGKRVLEGAGYRVACAIGPQDAVEKIARETPGLIVSDLMMTNLDSGFSLSRQIKSEPKLRGVPVIIVTAASSQRGFDFSPRTPEELSAMAADAFFNKPIDPKALLEKVRELLNRPVQGACT